MATKSKTVLILGAGASHGYGFPVGSQLRLRILALRDNDEASLAMEYGNGAIRNFVDAFLASQSYSIDSFLGRRQEYVGIGKAAIAYVLLLCEQSAQLTDDQNADHWYQLLVNELASESWDTFDPSWLSVVTFNYDRSLLHYLANALQHTYNKDRNEVMGRLSSVQMVHVYGWLGDPFGNIPFGGLPDENMNFYVREAAKALVIIPEGRDDSPTVASAQVLIDTADRICFLGFGFDATNVQRLGAPNCFLHKEANQFPRRTPKRTVATCLGLTDAECRRAIGRLFGSTVIPEDVSAGFYAKNCVNTLRETLILD